MPDAMDAVQERVLREERELLEQRRTPRPAGLTHCRRHDCREPIAPPRTALGAQLCLECQHEQDARDAHFRIWGRR